MMFDAASWRLIQHLAADSHVVLGTWTLVGWMLWFTFTCPVIIIITIINRVYV